jgi:hypothetical protein
MPDTRPAAPNTSPGVTVTGPYPPDPSHSPYQHQPPYPATAQQSAPVWQQPSPSTNTAPDSDDDFIVIREPAPSRVNLAWVIPAATIAAVVVFAAGWWSGSTYTTNKQVSDAQQATAALANTFTTAQTRCDPSKAGTSIADAGRTLTVDGKGTDDQFSESGLPLEGLTCLLDALNVPQAVREHMAQTRALDGRQSETWQGFTASWSYHPDSGINLIVQAQ